MTVTTTASRRRHGEPDPTSVYVNAGPSGAQAEAAEAVAEYIDSGRRGAFDFDGAARWAARQRQEMAVETRPVPEHEVSGRPFSWTPQRRVHKDPTRRLYHLWYIV